MAHRTYEWQGLYLAAILETDPQQMTIRLHAACAALDERVLRLDWTGENFQEQLRALRDAATGLQILRTEIERRLTESSKGTS